MISILPKLLNKVINVKFIISWLLFIIFSLAVYIYYLKNFELNSLFPIENYNQNITDWIKPSNLDNDKNLLDTQKQNIRMEEFFAHYFGELSPWNDEYVTKFLTQIPPLDLKTKILKNIASFSNCDQKAIKINYGLNFRPHSRDWILHIEKSINIDDPELGKFDRNKRAIAIHNINGRILPTQDVAFYSSKIAGEGYPFDNLQESTIWAGTPLYILHETKDKSWLLVLSPNFTAWVKCEDVAKVNEEFVNTWIKGAKKKLVAITRTEISIKDVESGLHRFFGYIGMIFPGERVNNLYKIMLPVSSENNQALIKFASLSIKDASQMPLLPTQSNFIQIINQLIGRPYGWGGMYFFNDCSLELKSLFTPFGIWLPSHSSKQIDPNEYLIQVEDLSEFSAEKRLEHLREKGHKFMTLIYIKNHIFLYLGSYDDPNTLDKEPLALSYQNVWGLKPITNDRRAVIGKAVLLPLLKKYPEDPNLVSHINSKVFILGYLDIFPTIADSKMEIEP